jgi:hypothetical protein
MSNFPAVWQLVLISQVEQQQLGLPFLIKLVWIAFLKLSLNHLQVGTLLDNIRQN